MRNIKVLNGEILSEENVKSGSAKFESKFDWLWILDPLMEQKILYRVQEIMQCIYL